MNSKEMGKIIVVMLICLFLTGCESPKPNTYELPRKTVTQIEPAEKTTVQIEPKADVSKTTSQDGAAKKLQYELKRVLGSCNRGIAKVQNIQIDKNVHVYFAIDDNFTNAMIKLGAKMDIKKILKAVQSSGYDYSEVIIVGTLPLGDNFGNTKESEVIQATYTHSTIARINWEGFLTDDVYNIADSVRIHPAFE